MSGEVLRLLELFDALPEPDRLSAAAEILRRQPPDESAMPDWHAEELRRRVAAADADPGASIPLEELRRELLAGRP